ncbi:hypothetical protein [Bacillus solitudinis]|nr:hypothetical protein [Bacillus solitudinis]
MNRSFMIFVIVSRTRWSEDALDDKTHAEIEQLYEEVMTRGQDSK